MNTSINTSCSALPVPPALAQAMAMEVLEALPGGVVVFSTEAPGVIQWANGQVIAWCSLGEPLSGPIQVTQYFKLPPKTDCPLFEGKGPEYPPFHGALLSLQHDLEGEERRVKFQYGQPVGSWVVCLISLFSEDMTLTQAHSDFVSTVSHEFRTPLTSIKGFADTLLRYGEQLQPDQQRRFISIIKDQADRLIRLVENLLSVSRMGAGRLKYSFRPIKLKRLSEKVIQNLQGKGPLNRVFVVDMADTLPDVWADPDKLEQILTNLIDNAVKYSFEGAEVRVSATVMAADPERIQVRITDHGVGIPDDHLPRIFSKFARIDNPLTREVEGTGLGLYITKSLTQAMDGEISIQSRPGTVEEPGETTFTLTFWVATPERQANYRRQLVEDPAELPGEVG